MPEWWIERGIGETRSALVEDGEIVEARIELNGLARAGSVVVAVLTDKGRNGRNAVARDQEGRQYLLPKGAGAAAEGSSVSLEVTREKIPGGEPWKRPLGRVSSAKPMSVEPLVGRLLPFPSPDDELGRGGWNDLIEEARSGLASFAGGELRIAVTPAMTLIDVDGHLDSDELSTMGAAEAAKAVRRLDIGGSIGIDLPSAGSKAGRQAAAEAIDEHLPRPFERTAVNGFGFVQIVRRRVRASLLELAQDRASFEARALLRRVALEQPGSKRLVAHPAVIAVIEASADWTDRLAGQVGGTITLRADPAVPISGGYAEAP